MQLQHQKTTCKQNYTTTVLIIFVFKAWAVKQEVECIFAGQVNLTSNRYLQIYMISIRIYLCHRQQHTGNCQALLQNHSMIYTTEWELFEAKQNRNSWRWVWKPLAYIYHQESAQCLETIHTSISKDKIVWSWSKIVATSLCITICYQFAGRCGLIFQHLNQKQW